MANVHTHGQKQWQKITCGDRTAKGGRGRPARVSEGTRKLCDLLCIPWRVLLGHVVGRRKPTRTVPRPLENLPDAIPHRPIWVKLKHAIFHSHVMHITIFAI